MSETTNVFWWMPQQLWWLSVFLLRYIQPSIACGLLSARTRLCSIKLLVVLCNFTCVLFYFIAVPTLCFYLVILLLTPVLRRQCSWNRAEVAVSHWGRSRGWRCSGRSAGNDGNINKYGNNLKNRSDYTVSLPGPFCSSAGLSNISNHLRRKMESASTSC